MISQEMLAEEAFATLLIKMALHPDEVRCATYGSNETAVRFRQTLRSFGTEIIKLERSAAMPSTPQDALEAFVKGDLHA